MTSSRSKVLVAALLGNALEFYDFTLYGVFAGLIAKTFFPINDPFWALMVSLSAFAVGSFVRPLGGLLFGFMGDHFGRKVALSFSILTMGIPTLVIGLLPGFESLGFLAPLTLMICRILQGLSNGGEYNGSAIFAIEHWGKKYYGFVGGLIAGSTAFGGLLAVFAGAYLTQPGMPDSAWRWAFYLGALISLLGFFMRRSLPESHEFEKNKTQKVFLFHHFKAHKSAIIKVFTMGAYNGALAYSLFGFSPLFMKTFLNISIHDALIFNIIGMLVFVFGCPLMGYVMQKMGHNNYLRLQMIFVVLFAYPVFLLFAQKTTPCLIMGQSLLGFMVATIAGPVHGISQNLFPVELRYQGISFSFAAGMGLASGITPPLMLWLLKTSDLLTVPSFYIIFVTVITYWAILYKSRDALKSERLSSVKVG